MCFVVGLLKIGGVRDVWRTFFEMCDKVWQGGGGSKLAKNSVTYFMDDPLVDLWLDYQPVGRPFKSPSGQIFLRDFRQIGYEYTDRSEEQLASLG